MANLSYAPTGSGPYADVIGWLNFPSSLAPNASTIVEGTLKDGSIITLQLRNLPSTGSNPVNFSAGTAPLNAQSPFGNAGGYAGVSGNVVFSTNPITNFNTILDFSIISVKDPSGVTIPNYSIIVTDGGTTGLNQSGRWVTAGATVTSIWSQLGIIGTGTSPTVTGFGFSVLQVTGTGTTYRGYLAAINSPITVLIELISTTNGQRAVAFGVALTKVNLTKFITDRVEANDQFDISISSSQANASTITAGSSSGTQLQTVPLYLTPEPGSNTTFQINEILAPGSSSTISNYNSIVQYSNLTPQGTTVPVTSPLGQPVTISFGDNIVATIVNTPITSTLTALKAVDKINVFPGEILTYTVTLSNSGPLTILNSTFIDTIPTQGNLVPNSVTFNGVTVPGTVAPPGGLNIGTIPVGTSTITFQVALQNTIPLGTSIQNIGTAFGNNILVSSTVPTSANSNIITSILSGTVSMSTIKMVNKNVAILGDILTYSIPITNNGNTTAFNIVFIDTIPNGTTFILNSLNQDGILVPGNPNPPGVTLPNSIGPGVTSTVTFMVSVNNVLSSNPILNSATENYQYIFDITTEPFTTTIGSSSTNIVETFINLPIVYNNGFIKYCPSNSMRKDV